MDVTITAGSWCPELDLMPGETITVTFENEDVDTIEVVVVGNTAPVRWTCDGSEPGEDAGWYVPTDGVDQRQPPTAGETVVKLWSSGTGKACVQRG